MSPRLSSRSRIPRIRAIIQLLPSIIGRRNANTGVSFDRIDRDRPRRLSFPVIAGRDSRRYRLRLDPRRRSKRHVSAASSTSSSTIPRVLRAFPRRRALSLRLTRKTEVSAPDCAPPSHVYPYRGPLGRLAATPDRFSRDPA